MYTLSYPSGRVVNTETNTEVLPGPDMDAYVAWLEQGNGPTPLQDPVDPFPRITVSAWQIRKALNQTGQRSAVESAVSGSGNIDLQDGWLHATEFESDHPMMAAMQGALGMTAAQMYAVFQLAETL